ncbi:hydroxycinnamoyl-CoA:piscidic acid hydroxycinnamoyltransferase-like [Vicia villosa]|uniref:hydroxycinnamoyl-CoA:piscidic acid hydroxycinnamoyltransferase-like n=1 Tax=Vicia villosa TaxID=3911 RepID=UPI00273C55B4|nr:hydroxycinnamoyl-CoA:piscidic acid hydroxycinnamoyltransferase-like [Vicia villosa]
MVVCIQSQSIVIPSKPTPSTKLFSLCEQIKLRTHAPLLYVYNPHKNISTFLETLRKSLSQVLVIYYPIAGRLSWIKDGRWELNCNAKGAILLEAKCEANLKDLGDFVPNNLVSQLIPNINYDVPIEDIPLLVVQLTRFRCGGFTLGVAFCRGAADGTAAMRFMSAWAKLARGENLDSNDFPCHDRTLLILHLHSEFEAPPKWIGQDLGDDTETSVVIMKLTREQVLKLKKNVSSRGSLQSTSKDVHKTKPFTSFEVIAGHIWRCVSKARYTRGNSDQPTRLSTLINCRNRLKPPLPSSYVGNTAFPTVTPTRSFNDLIRKPLRNAVEDVRAALERVTGEHVMSALDYIDREKDMELLRYNFHYPAKSVCEEGQNKGNPNLFVVSWMNFSYKETDFGLGEPFYFGPGYMDSEGKAFVMNNNGDGDGIVVAISLEASFMDVFKKIFYEDIEEVFCSSKL